MINTVEKIYFDGNFVCYKTTYQDSSVSLVPLKTDNTDYQAIQEWIAEGGVVIDNGGNN